MQTSSHPFGWSMNKRHTHPTTNPPTHPPTCSSQGSSLGSSMAPFKLMMRKFTPPHLVPASVASFPSGKTTQSFWPLGVKGRMNSRVHCRESSRNSPKETSIRPGEMGNSISSCSTPCLRAAAAASLAVFLVGRGGWVGGVEWDGTITHERTCFVGCWFGWNGWVGGWVEWSGNGTNYNGRTLLPDFVVERGAHGGQLAELGGGRQGRHHGEGEGVDQGQGGGEEEEEDGQEE